MRAEVLDQHGCVVLLNSGVAEHSVAVAVAPAVKALNVVLR
jgi:hypothetical protein